ncbi:hypothetical protein [Adlercreutzia sp. ZJ304]|uniref:hypothetical protein n=1 Tax=Adlercreutzia sp. ZJ304 TaxID=2709791 RepID=UPI0013EB8A3E|nr:hypothetical protein [Adlercreutzia sp. ZJ304]
MNNNSSLINCITLLHETEESLRDAIACFVTHKTFPDERIADLLKEASNIQGISDRLAAIDKTAYSDFASPNKTPIAKMRLNEIDDSVINRGKAFLESQLKTELPVFFVDNSRLYKIGSKRSTEEAGVWMKSVSMDIAKQIMIAIEKTGHVKELFTRLEIQESMPSAWPAYYVEIVFSALLENGILTKPKRGHYHIEISDVYRWISILEKLPKRGDLMNVAN